MTEPESQENRWQRLLARLDRMENASEGSTSDALRRDVHHLVRAITQTANPVLSDEECFDLLPGYVDEEISDFDVTRLYPDVKRHLDLSPRADEEYARLLELALAEEAATFTKFYPRSGPDLSFLPPRPPVTLSSYTQTLAQWVVQQHAPQWQEDLEIVAEVFFEHIAKLGRNLQLSATWAPTLGFGAGEVSTSLQILAIIYLATLSLITRFSATELAQLSANALGSLAEEEANRVGRQLRLTPQAAQTFAELYAPLLIANRGQLVAVATHEQE